MFSKQAPSYQHQNLEILTTEEKVAYLGQVYSVHLKAFPYQNFELREISQQHPINRHSASLFSTKGNGGFCFQLAQSLYQILQKEGFTVSRCLSRVLAGVQADSKEALAIPSTHLVLAVDIDGKRYFLDPGFAESAPPLPMLIDRDTVLERAYDKFRLTQMGEHYVLQQMKKNKRDQWVQISQSNLKEASEEQINVALLKLSRHPNLRIRDHLTIIGLKTATGGKSLFWESKSNKIAFAIEDQDKYVKKYLDSTTAHALLASEFNITHVSLDEFEKYCRSTTLPKPKKPWVIDFPLDERGLTGMRKNLEDAPKLSTDFHPAKNPFT